MAIVRELTTVLDFAVDPTGLNQAEAAMSKMKASLLALGKLFGFVFAAEKLYEMVDGLISSAKEIARVTYQLTRMARAGDDIATATERAYEIAQATGIEYVKVLDTYREFLNESKNLNVSQDQLLLTVENIYKSLRLGAASSEQITMTMDALNRGFRRGSIGVRQFGLLVDEATEFMEQLEAGSGKTREQLEAMAKAGTLTAKFIVDSIGKPLTKLNDEFAKRPRKLGEAFTYAWNAAVKLTLAIWKIVNTASRVGKWIVQAVNFIEKAVNKLIDTLGGLENTIRLIGITAAVALGPKLISMLYYATIGTLRWAAANALVVAEYLALGLAIVGVALAIEDIVVWMQGGRSLIGKWVGPFDELMTKLREGFDKIDFFGGFRALEKLFSGDFQGALTEFINSLKTLEGVLGDITLVAGSVGFAALIARLTGITKYIKEIGEAAKVTRSDIEKIWEMPKPKPGSVPAVTPSGGSASPSGATGTGGTGPRSFWGGIKNFSRMMIRGSIAAIPLAIADYFIDKKIAEPALGTDVTGTVRTGGGIPGIIASMIDPKAMKDFISSVGERMWYGPPGIAGPGTGATVNQDNNITIQIDPALDIVNRIKAEISTFFAEMSRQARDANAVTEAPKQ